MKNFTRDDLKQGMVCELRNGSQITFLDNNTGIYYYNDRINILSMFTYNDDLTNKVQKDYDIMKVSFGNETIYERPESNLFFEPKKNEYYYYIKDVYIDRYKNNSDYDDHIIKTNIVFKTEEEAEKELLRQQAKIRVIKEIARLNKGWTPNWNDNESKHYIYFSYNRNKLLHDSCVKSKSLDNNLYLKTYYVANQLIETHSDDLKLMLEVE